MKKIALLFLFVSTAFSAVASDYDFSALQGLKKKNGDIWFEISGYDIYATSKKGKLSDAKKIAALKKKYKIKHIRAEFSDSLLEIPNKIIELQSIWEGNPNIVQAHEVYYILQHAENELVILSFWTLNQRDLSLEQAFVKAFFNKTLDNFISNDWTGKSIIFVGRTISSLGNACGWRSPHNFLCKGGQISWSEFSSADAANLDLENRIIADNFEDYAILSNEYIDVIFENIPTVAYRVAYKQQDKPQENIYYLPLIVYYISQEVRGRYISCIMSNYGANRNDYRLASLLQNFMSIPNPPEWASNRLDVQEYETLNYDNEW
jgi:hypothetical protein